MMEIDELCFDARVGAARVDSAKYAGPRTGEPGEVAHALVRAATSLGWWSKESGCFARVIPPGARVLLKPNFVMHHNRGGGGLEPLITHASVIRAVVQEVLRTEAAEVRVGDAPLQECDFDQLLEATGLGAWSKELAARDSRFKGVVDLRRTVCVYANGVRIADEDRRSEDLYGFFDLSTESLLEEITARQPTFRVTCYDPRLMSRTHSRGQHRYLIANEVLAADVVINLPKLKTHMKAGLTNALKNVVGINGNKEFLPHHRVGGSDSGGDCYPGSDPLKRLYEYVLDQRNAPSSALAERLWAGAGTQFERLLRLKGDELGVEGSWSGNDTIWRTCLDLNRVLLYGRADCMMADTAQRRVLHVSDAIVAGQGDGPLRPSPLALGMVLMGGNAAAIDWVSAHLLGYDAMKIPLVREAFGGFRWPLSKVSADEVTLVGDWPAGDPRDVLRSLAASARVIHPVGWRDAAAPSSSITASRVAQ